MFLLLVACGVIYLLLGDITEAIMLLGFVFVVMGITIYQEGKTEKAIDALRDLSSPRALVIRDGIQKRIAGREVVKDDIIIIREGDRVPADAVLLWDINLTADESLLTGESVPCIKIHQRMPIWNPSGRVEITRHFYIQAALSYKGKNRKGYRDRYPNRNGKNRQGSPSGTKRTDAFTEGNWQNRKIHIHSRHDSLCNSCDDLRLNKRRVAPGYTFRNYACNGDTSEEFPVVLTIFLAMGAWRILQKQVLTRKAAAIETLGSTTVLCVDKTGTLTQNRMSIKKLFAGHEFYNIKIDKQFRLPEKFHELVEYGILASKKEPFDPMEKALGELGHKTLFNTEHLHNWPLIEEYPISKKIMALSHVWETPDRTGFVVSAKGAPEAIADLCHLKPEEKDKLNERVNSMAGEGLRILGVAKATFENRDCPNRSMILISNSSDWLVMLTPSVPQCQKLLRNAITPGSEL